MVLLHTRYESGNQFTAGAIPTGSVVGASGINDIIVEVNRSERLVYYETGVITGSVGADDLTSFRPIPDDFKVSGTAVSELSWFTTANGSPGISVAISGVGRSSSTLFDVGNQAGSVRTRGNKIMNVMQINGSVAFGHTFSAQDAIQLEQGIGFAAGSTFIDEENWMAGSNWMFILRGSLENAGAVTNWSWRVYSR